MGAAPLKENLAAGLIRLTGWDGSQPLVDPCCGSAVLLIEAALAALQQAPGLERRFALEGWADFKPELWDKEVDRARQRRRGDLSLPPLLGIEADPAIADQARANVEAAGLSGVIRICTGSFEDEALPEGPGVLVCNPPYGQRIGDEQELDALYSALGQFVRQEASGWQLWLLSGNPKLTGALRLKASRRIPVSNGGIDCRWLQYEIR
jgi:putative N6-adenine-specific DNA methylase